MCTNSFYFMGNCCLQLPKDFDSRDLEIITECSKLNRDLWKIEKEGRFTLRTRGSIRTDYYNSDKECEKCMLCQLD